MQTQIHELFGASPGVRHSLQVLRFGVPGARPKVTLQAALHADEVPAMLAAQRLRERLAALEAAGELRGEVVLIPAANPLGLAQQLLGQHQGRFDLRDGVNFNRGYADLGSAVAAAVEGRLGQDPAHNVALIRDSLAAAAQALVATTPTQDLKHRLLREAIDADYVLDLHCDSQAVMHLYALTPQADIAEELGALLGARAILLADESGDSPFDEACSRPWLQLQQRFPTLPIPLACFATTVELRGENDTSHELAQHDADALVAFLRRRGVIAPDAAPLPAPRCRATPLAGSEPVTAPRAGVVVFHVDVGDTVAAGAAIADLVDVHSGEVQTLACQSAGLVYARSGSRWACPGQRLAKIAGTTLARTGKLLSP